MNYQVEDNSIPTNVDFPASVYQTSQLIEALHTRQDLPVDGDQHTKRPTLSIQK